jgi:phosphoserine phosphatase RsbU/P
VPAAMYMAVARTKLRDFASPDMTPSEIVTAVNRSLAPESNHEMFVTMVFGYYDLLSGELIYVNAGHNPPYVIRNNGELCPLDSTGPIVAPLPDAAFPEARCRIEPGELLVLYTDGITEAVSEQGELFGEERLKAILRSMACRPVAEVCQSVIQAAQRFSDGDLADDATVLVLRRTR